jgi:hypothetical protein
MTSKIHLIFINGKRGDGVEGRGGGRGLSPWSGAFGETAPQKNNLGASTLNSLNLDGTWRKDTLVILGLTVFLCSGDIR